MAQQMTRILLNQGGVVDVPVEHAAKIQRRDFLATRAQKIQKVMSETLDPAVHSIGKAEIEKLGREIAGLDRQIPTDGIRTVGPRGR